MAMNHISKYWLEAEDDLVDLVAMALCKRHGAEIFGDEVIDAEFLRRRKVCFQNDARDCISIVRAYDNKEDPLEALHPVKTKDVPI